MPKQIQNGSFLPLSETPNETAELLLEDIGELGDTLAEFEGKYINVFGGIPGEKVLCRIVRYRRRRRAIVSAIVLDVLKSSPYRISVPCQYFGSCSGCQWQHIDYKYQLKLKRDLIQRALRTYGELADLQVSSTIASKNIFGYRNHARFTVRDQGSLGFVNRITKRFVKIDTCKLMAPWINKAVKNLQQLCSSTSQLSIRYGVNTDDWLIQPKIDNDEIELETGQPYYHEQLFDRKFQISSPSFFQVNTVQAETLIRLVKSRLELTGEETLVDAYAGVGTFAALLAGQVKKVIAIEESYAATKDAVKNTDGIKNLEIKIGKVEEIVNDFRETPTVVLLDPSRNGCELNVLETISRWQPDRVLYVSCDPKSLARDLSILVKNGLMVQSVDPVDMFPQTYHVESVSVLKSIRIPK